VPVTPTYPGVYIEEIPSGVHPITGVATSIAAFVDFFARGPMNEATEIFSFGDFQRIFGGLDDRSEASYAIQQFFLNGGTDAWVVRVASGTGVNAPKKAAVAAERRTSATDALTFTAASEGQWGNDLRVRIDYATSAPASRFNVSVLEVDVRNGSVVVVAQEDFLDLSMDATDPRFVTDVVNNASTLITVEAASTTVLPAATGTLGAADFAAAAATTELKAHVTFAYNDGVTPDDSADVSLGNGPIATVDDAAGRLEAGIRAANPTKDAWSRATVKVIGQRLQVQAGLSQPATVLTFSDVGADSTATATLGLVTNAEKNVAAYALGSAAGNVQKQDGIVAGKDGSPPDATDLVGTNAVDPPTGIYALDKADLFNILCLPRVARTTGTNAFAPGQVTAAVSQATTYCDAKQAFLVLDTPSDVTNVLQLKQFLGSTLNGLRDKNAAFYFPRTTVADPVNNFRPRSIGASGTMAGIYARTDAARGVWKAPAGTEASLRGVQKLDYKLTDAENGILNPLGINCLRTFDVYGNVGWGARTLDGADQQASEWKYIPVRRFALFLEVSLYRGTKWVVFEPNDEPLWAQIRLNVGAFMHNLFRQGAFQGTTPKEAYLVKCDKETTNQTDIDNGVVNILVGFAPLKPAEFVIIQIQQLAGQIET
jgi:phage tail sheath protein FI